jgi:hypothetical protein
LFAKLEKPVMIGLKGAWPQGTSAETWPDPLPDLYAGEPVVLSAKVSAMGGELHLSGMLDGKPWAAALRLSDAVEGVGVAKLWARSKIDSLEAKAYSGVSFGVIEKDIETVALEHHLVSSQTSLVAIDKSKSRPDGQGVATVDMPVNLPEGWVYDKVFGPQGGVQHAKRSAGTMRMLSMDPSGYGIMPSPVPLGYDAAAAPSASVSEAMPPVDTAEMPDTPAVGQTPPAADDADQTYPVLPLTVVPKPEADPLASLKAPDTNHRLAILALVLALLSAVTVIFWRNHRRDYASPRRIGRRD